MASNQTIRADVRRRIMESAQELTGRGERTFARPALLANMERGVRPNVFSDELAELRIAGRLFEVRPKSGARPALYSLEPPKIDPGGAPDFKPGFPSAGAMIGPAWRAMWAAMADGEWHDPFDLGGIGAEAGGCRPLTARNLLYPATKGGYVEAEARYDESRARWRIWYRRTAVAG